MHRRKLKSPHKERIKYGLIEATFHMKTMKRERLFLGQRNSEMCLQILYSLKHGFEPRFKSVYNLPLRNMILDINFFISAQIGAALICLYFVFNNLFAI